MQRNLENYRVAIACLTLLGLPAAAESIIRSDNPLQISADEVIVDELAAITIYRGSVVIVQGASLITGDEVVADQDDSDNERYQAIGRPAHLEFQPESQTEMVYGQANTMIYTLGKEMVDLIDQAKLDRGSDKLHGSRIAYFASTDRATVMGNDTGRRVRATYHPSLRAKGSR